MQAKDGVHIRLRRLHRVTTFSWPGDEGLHCERGGGESSVSYDIQSLGIKTALFGGEGLFVTTLTGPGRIVLQS